MPLRFKVRLTILLVLFLWEPAGFMAPAGAQEAMASPDVPRIFDLAAAVQFGLDHNPRIDAARFAVSGAEAGEKSARGNFFPQIDLSASKRRLTNESASESDQDYLDQDGDTRAVRLSLPLFAGFSVLNTFQRAQINKELTEARLIQEKLNLVFEIQRRFLELVKAREDWRSAESAVKRLEHQLESANAYCRVGMKPWLVVLQIKAELAAAERFGIEVKNALRVAAVRLNKLLDLPAASAVEYRGAYAAEVLSSPVSSEECCELALLLRPDAKVARKSVELAEKDVKLAGSRFYPRVSLDSDYTRQKTDYEVTRYKDIDRDYWSVGINLQMNLFTGGRNFYAVKEAGEAASRARALVSDLENTIVMEVTAAYIVFQDAGEKIVSSQKVLEAAAEAYEMASARFRTTMGTSTELLDAQAKMTDAEVVLNQSVTGQRLSLAQLYNAMGHFQYALDTPQFR
ncbi:MAG: TolC family protein [Pseudomonadota bacterium]